MDIPVQLGIDATGREDVRGWFCSIKMDGCRALWDGSKLWTRNGNEIHAPEWMIGHLPSIPLDCEIGFGRNTIHRTISAIRYCKADDPRWAGCMLRIFGSPVAGKTYQDELSALGSLAIPAANGWGDSSVPVAIVAQVWLNSEVNGFNLALAAALARQEIKQGGEGVVLRNPAHVCHKSGDKVNARSADFLKIKADTLKYALKGVQ